MPLTLAHDAKVPNRCNEHGVREYARHLIFRNSEIVLFQPRLHDQFDRVDSWGRSNTMGTKLASFDSTRK